MSPSPSSQWVEGDGVLVRVEALGWREVLAVASDFRDAHLVDDAVEIGTEECRAFADLERLAGPDFRRRTLAVNEELQFVGGLHAREMDAPARDHGLSQDGRRR